MNGSNTIQPTIELATANGSYPHPMYYANGNNDGFFGGEGIWALLLLAFLFSGNGFSGFGGNGNGMYPWIANGQQEIMSNTNNGFDTLHLSNQVEGVRDGVYGISNQICNATSDVVSAINGGFSNAEISANSRQIANMQQSFNNQIATLQGFNDLGSRLDNCCCENRLATCQTQNIVQNEANTTRFADANNTRDIITNATSNTQAILDKLCQLELDAKNDKISDLERQLTMADLKASQNAQNAFISQGFANEVDALYNRLNSCPVPTTPVYGRTPIFTCQNNGCGCGNNF